MESGFSRKFCPSAQDSWQCFTFEGQICSFRRAFTSRWAKSAHVVSHLPVGLNEEKKSTVIFRDTPNEAHRYVRYQQVQGSGQNGQNSHTSGVPTFLLATELGPFCLRFCLVIVLFSAARYTHA